MNIASLVARHSWGFGMDWMVVSGVRRLLAANRQRQLAKFGTGMAHAAEVARTILKA
ncbi:MAG: hypothetical protein ACOYMG_26695 [Candidatus Methylumidiphilus sp.]